MGDKRDEMGEMGTKFGSKCRKARAEGASEGWMSGEKQGFIWRWRKGWEKQNSTGKCMLWQIGRCRRERRTELPPTSQPCKVFHLMLAKESEQLRKGLKMTKNGCEASR